MTMEQLVESSLFVDAGDGAVRDAVTEQPALLVADAEEAAAQWPSALHGSLTAELGTQATVRHAVLFDIRPAEERSGVTVVPVRWRPMGHEHVVPAFTGRFELRPAGGGARTKLTLRGTYEVPLGVLGRLGDRAVGRRVAERTIESLLEAAAPRLARAAATAAWAPSDDPWWETDQGVG